jgi:hypothetical protein
MNPTLSNESASNTPLSKGSLFDGLFEDLYEGVVEAFQESDWMTKGQASKVLNDIPASQVRMILNDNTSRYRRPASSGPKVIQASGYFYSDEPKMIG